MNIEKLKIVVLIVEKEKEPYIQKIWNQLEDFRKIVGNENIEIIEYEKALLIYNEDALKRLLPINRYVDDKAIRGIFIVAGNNEKELDFKELTEEQIEKYTSEFSLQREEELELE